MPARPIVRIDGAGHATAVPRGLEAPRGTTTARKRARRAAGRHGRWRGARKGGACALATFEGLPHRTAASSRRAAACTFVDDSKATNPAAALRAIASFAAPLVWIGGGRAKGLDLSELADAAGQRARAAILIGEAAPALERDIAGRVEVRRVDTIEEAVRVAGAIAREGDVVLLAPGCSSLDQFRSFEERGDRFAAAVAALGKERP